MDRRSRLPNEHRQRSIDTVATFVALMHADERGERSRVEESLRALDRLGVVVRFARQAPSVPAKGVTS